MRECSSRESGARRALSPQGLSDWKLLRNSGLFGRLCREQKIVETRLLDGYPLEAGWAGILEHERLENLSYPYEWPFSMLRDAAVLHLEILEMALAQRPHPQRCHSFQCSMAR